MNYTYLILNFLVAFVPFIFTFHPKIKFHKTWKAFFPAVLITALIFSAWDELFTRHGIWEFNPDYLSGLYLLHLPVEEVLFFICIPYACVFTYHCIRLFIKIKWNHKSETTFTLPFITILLLIAIFNYSKLYTSVTLFSLATLILVLKYVLQVTWLPQFYFSYLILLFPFLVTNGILTGTGVDEPVVRYNDAENLGIRFLTIPVEDIFYGLELILLNVAFYEFFLQKFRMKSNHA